MKLERAVSKKLAVPQYGKTEYLDMEVTKHLFTMAQEAAVDGLEAAAAVLMVQQVEEDLVLLVECLQKRNSFLDAH